ncbi:hypothetical protein PLICRDRAFT_86429 [Plicaturopsis crispa FD-325 SS-3]|nr:hypothetical protein PLICRDRAFT_86429 [Plicaturopsis crispa FD-325 SS-3]
MAQPRSEASMSMLSACPTIPTAPACPVACPPCPTIASISLEPIPAISYVSAAHSGSEEYAAFTSAEATLGFDCYLLQVVKHQVAAQLRYNGLFILLFLLYTFYRRKQQAPTSTPNIALDKISSSSETDTPSPSFVSFDRSRTTLAAVSAGGPRNVTAGNTVAAKRIQSCASLSRPTRSVTASPHLPASSQALADSHSAPSGTADGTKLKRKRTATAGDAQASCSSSDVVFPRIVAVDHPIHDVASLSPVRESIHQI